VTDKEHQRNLKRIAKAVEASNDKLRAKGILVKEANDIEKQIQIPEQKPEIRPRATN
jgi:hypothetical protein